MEFRYAFRISANWRMIRYMFGTRSRLRAVDKGSHAGCVVRASQGILFGFIITFASRTTDPVLHTGYNPCVGKLTIFSCQVQTVKVRTRVHSLFSVSRFQFTDLAEFSSLGGFCLDKEGRLPRGYVHSVGDVDRCVWLPG